jgi:hypothetical protein
MKTKCLYPLCEKSATGRGLCQGHYNLATKLVKGGRVTWEQLESMGKSRRAKSAGAVTEWFLEATNPELVAAQALRNSKPGFWQNVSATFK